MDAKLGTSRCEWCEGRYLGNCSQNGYEKWRHRKRMHNVAIEDGVWAIQPELHNVRCEVVGGANQRSQCILILPDIPTRRQATTQHSFFCTVSSTSRFYHCQSSIKWCWQRPAYTVLTRGAKPENRLVPGFVPVKDTRWEIIYLHGETKLCTVKPLKRLFPKSNCAVILGFF